MPKTFISILFSAIFVLFITAPTIVSLLENNIDMSMFYNIAEEENSKETVKLISLGINTSKELHGLFNCLDQDNTFNFYLNTYSELHLDLVSPPPERHI